MAMELSITDDVEEQFEECGESTPYLRCLATREERMVAPGSDATPLTGKRRIALGHFLRAAIAEIWTTTTRMMPARMTCAQKVWLDSMHMCDVLAGRGLDFADRDASHPIAVLRILWKAEFATVSLSSASLSTLIEVLRRQHGLAVQPALPQEIDSAELRILGCPGLADMSVALSIHTWLAAFFTRIRVLTKQPETESKLGAVMTRIWQQSYSLGVVVVLHEPSLGLLAPRPLAMGLLGLGCVSLGALPLHSARPEWLEAAEWERVYVRAMGPVPASIDDAPAALITQIIQRATDSSMDAFKGACGNVALVVPDVPSLGARGPVTV